MNNLKDTPTADLLAEWSLCKKAIIYISNRESSHGGVWQRAKKQRCIDESEAIAAELDRRATEAGIHLTVHGYFRYEFYEFDYIGYGKHTNKMACLRGEITAKEQHDLEGWLLIKNEK